MTTLIYCTQCNSVLCTKKMVYKYRYMTKEFMGIDSMPILKKFLAENKNHIIWDWTDIEQTKEQYLKYCPLCNEVHYFEPFK